MAIKWWELYARTHTHTPLGLEWGSPNEIYKSYHCVFPQSHSKPHFLTLTHCRATCQCKKVKLAWYRPGVAQRVGRGISLLFYDRGTRRMWVVSSTPRLHFTPGKDPVPIVQEAGWAPGPVWTGGKSCPHWDSIPDLPAHSQSLYRLSYPAHNYFLYFIIIT